MRIGRAPELRFGVTEERLTGHGGLSMLARMVQYMGLAEMLAKRVRVKRRRRGCRDEQMLMALIYAFCTGNGRLSAVDALAADEAVCRAAGLRAAPDSRRLGEYLQRMSGAGLSGLQACARQVSGRLIPQLVRGCLEEWGYVPVFVDGTGIEVEGKLFERAAVGYNGERQYWLHAAFVGGAWVSGRLRAGGGDVRGDWREQLEADVAPLLATGVAVWLRADAVYYCEEFVEYCRQRGWDYSLSVTDRGKKAPILRLVEAMELAEADWQELEEGGEEQAITVSYRPGRWAREQVYLVIRRERDGEQWRLAPDYTLILVSRDDLEVGELARRHRGKQGQENAFKGPLRELGLHHPPCRAYAANQAFYACGQIAQLLLRCVQYQLLPAAARRHGLQPLIRYFVRSVARVTRSGRRLHVLFARCNCRLDWLLYAAKRLEPT